jgi:hypothetical protein
MRMRAGWNDTTPGDGSRWAGGHVVVGETKVSPFKVTLLLVTGQLGTFDFERKTFGLAQEIDTTTPAEVG